MEIFPEITYGDTYKIINKFFPSYIPVRNCVHLSVCRGQTHSTAYAYPIRGSLSELFTRLPSSSAHSPRARFRALHCRTSKTNALTSTAFCMLVEISHGVQTGHGEAP